MNIETSETLELKGWQQENAELVDEIEKLKNERCRLLTLATKWCDTSHHDWQEILQLDRGNK